MLRWKSHVWRPHQYPWNDLSPIIWEFKRGTSGRSHPVHSKQVAGGMVLGAGGEDNATSFSLPYLPHRGPSTPHTLKPNILCFCDRDLMKIFLPPTINVIYKYKSGRQTDTQYPDPDSRQNTPSLRPAPPRPAWLVFRQFIQSEACPDFSLARCLL